MIPYEELKEKQVSQSHKQLLAHVMQLVDLSREHMGKKYCDWDKYDQTYRGIREEDAVDKKAKQKKDPVKMVVPIAFAQLQTFVAFCISVLTQREFFFELIGSAPEDFKAAEFAEALLQRDLDHNKFTTQLYQFLIDIGRFGIGVMKCHWVEEKQYIKTSAMGRMVSFLKYTWKLLTAQSTEMEAIKYQGNKITNISPYRFFPDPRLPLCRFQEGEFVASEDEYTFADLKQLESQGIVSGIDHVEPFKDPSVHRRGSRLGFIDVARQQESFVKTSAKPPVCVTEVQIKIVPSQFKLGDKAIGEETHPVKYLIWYANDARIIRCEPLNYVHDEFTYVLSEMTPDMNHFLNAGLLESIDMLQDTMSWFINSHVTSVRRTIQNQFLVDPTAIEMDDLKNHRTVIRLRPEAARSGVDRWVKQLEVRDVTQNHVADAEALHTIAQVVTGVNETLLGQVHSGRRSATEHRNVATSAASRLKMYCSVIFISGLEPLGRQMLSNLRDGLTVETFVRMFGSAATMEGFQQFKKITKADLVGDYDFAFFDGTLPSEKNYMADVLSEFLLALFKSPEAIMLTGLDPKLMTYEVMRLKGIRYPERFSIQNNPALMQQLMMQQQLQQQQQLNQNGQPNTNGKPKVQGNGQTGATGTNPAVAQTPGNDILSGLLRG